METALEWVLAAAPKAYQVTGEVVELTDDVVTVLKGKLQRMNPLEADGYSTLLTELLSLEQRRRQLLERSTGT